MKKFTEDECLPNFELQFKFLENLRKPLTLKSTRKRIEEKNKMAETREESQTKVLTEETKQAPRKKTKQVSMPKMSSIYSGKANHCDLNR